MFVVLGVDKHIKKEGYVYIDRKLKNLGLNVVESFVVKGNQRKFITSVAVKKLLQSEEWKVVPYTTRISFLNHMQILSDSSCPNQDKTQSTGTSEEATSSSNNPPVILPSTASGKTATAECNLNAGPTNVEIVMLNGCEVTLAVFGKEVYLSCTEFFTAMGIFKHVSLVTTPWTSS